MAMTGKLCPSHTDTTLRKKRRHVRIPLLRRTVYLTCHRLTSVPLSIQLHNESSRIDPPPLACMAFGVEAESGAIVHEGLQPLDRESAHEIWQTTAPEAAGEQGWIRWHADSYTLFGSASVSLDTDTDEITYRLYRDIFDCLRTSGFPHLLRVWHYLPRINVGAGDHEHYKRFCRGRARAFDEWHGSSAQLPAGTAIGSRDGNQLLVYFMATRYPVNQVENPRQVSAFEYPRRYGPRKPMFSRAVIWQHGDQTQLLASGTASIVGHESKHRGDLQGQLQETWNNLESLRDNAAATAIRALRVYIRHEADLPEVRAFVTQRVGAHIPVLYLHADICRAELLVEIEGVYDIPDHRGHASRHPTE